MKKPIAFLLALAACWLPATVHGVIAYPYPITLTQPDGSEVTVQLHGDEFLNWMTLDGEVVERGKDGFLQPTGEGHEPSALKIEAARRQRTAMLMQQETAPRQNAAEHASLSIGTHHFLVLLIETSDVRFTTPDAQGALSALLNDSAFTVDGATGSVKDYFTDQSCGRFNPIFDVVGPITIPDSMHVFTASKGQTQDGAPLLLSKACQIADSIIDFTRYDIDQDGLIDNVFFYFAGYNAAEGTEGTIWPHRWSVTGKRYFDGKRLSSYACTSEYRGQSGNRLASIGTFCHEFSHVLGLPDFYDTNDDVNGTAAGLGAYSLMGSGNYNNSGKTPPNFNCMERLLLGWMDSIPELPAASGHVTLAPLQTNAAFKSPCDSINEFFCYEFRNGEKWDASVTAGLLIYHVDKSQRLVGGISAAKRWSSWQGINAVFIHECFKLMQANGDGGAISFGNGTTTFNANTSPSNVDWDGNLTGYDLYDIAYTDDQASFNLIYQDGHRLFGYLRNEWGTPVEGGCVAVGEQKAYSDSAGYFSLPLDTAIKKVTVSIQAETFSPWRATLNIPQGAFFIDVYLAHSQGWNEVTLSKNNGLYKNRIGFGTAQLKTYAKVLFTAKEMSPHTGKTLQKISYIVSGEPGQDEHMSSAAFLKLNGETLLEVEPDTLLKNDWTDIDISGAAIDLPYNTTMEVGYWVCSDSKWPIALDDQPSDGSSYVSSNGTVWTQLTASGGMKNLLINILLKDFVAGDEIVLKPDLLGYSCFGEICLEGLDDRLPVSFYALDGRLLGTAQASDGRLVWTAPSAVSLVMVRQGETAIKMAVNR